LLLILLIHFKSQYELLKNLHKILKQPCAQCKVSSVKHALNVQGFVCCDGEQI